MSPHYRGQKKYFSNKRKSVRRGNEPGSLQSGVRIAKDTGPLAQTLLMSQTSSSIHVYKKQHAVVFCSTWMMSCVHFRKKEGQTFRTGILVKGWTITARLRRRKKEGKTKFSSKTMFTHSFQCLFVCPFTYCQTSVLSFTNGGILSGYRSLLALHLSETPSLKTGTSPPSCQLLDNQLYMSPDFHLELL